MSNWEEKGTSESSPTNTPDFDDHDLFVESPKATTTSPADLPDSKTGEVVTHLGARNDGEVFGWDQLAYFGNFVLSMDNFTEDQRAILNAVAETKNKSTIIEIAKKLYEDPGRADSLDFLYGVIQADPTDHVAFIDTVVEVAAKVGGAELTEKKDIIRVFNAISGMLGQNNRLTAKVNNKDFTSKVTGLAAAENKGQKLEEIKSVVELLAIWPGKATK